MVEGKHKLNYQTEPKKNGCYTTREISQMLGIGMEAARNLIHSHQFESIRLPNEFRVLKSSFDAWLENAKEANANGKHS